MRRHQLLGRPTHSMSVLLVSILGGAAMGSAVGGRLARRRGTLFVLRWAALVSAVLIVLQTFSLDALLPLLSGASFSLRVVYSALLVAPLGFFLGIPFPMSLRLLGGSGLDAVIPRAWGVNGIASVIGSALSIALSMTGGFTLSLVTAALLYLFLFFLTRTFLYGRRTDERKIPGMKRIQKHETLLPQKQSS